MNRHHEMARIDSRVMEAAYTSPTLYHIMQLLETGELRSYVRMLEEGVVALAKREQVLVKQLVDVNIRNITIPLVDGGSYEFIGKLKKRRIKDDKDRLGAPQE